ncbi:hypothetical protein A2761_00140 [Candidatus Kaiserbacteria bacterium RIFCSPHIGHO2_01_FULL_51_33]|uniref:Rod shape-determining protein MreC beta-barrel core domain-containing protein n=1 Tax=Candidatus Kaiserbacteria bacterium RIFCSPLOWO2_01_FULL_51_21 TaxID=1798508 RepID=A0A1F6EDZ3_9BACT|nr:MAG: hypothetical protein A2761_00140 [Candidatus Kaiserbacteria bacterium RIFCSPHIGHO2_01_FULL_51_33]OGG71883.1 MAG: hypothetical protein A3A35_03150 [Candidatus Kaiserbacteria bacterium RIFCSPLOWO2_01_FULL_51_21]
MNYLRRSKRPPDPFTKFVGGVFLFAVGTLALVQFFAPSFFPAVLHSLGGALWRSDAASVSSLGIFNYLRSKEDLILQNRDLKRELQEAKLRLAIFSMLQEEYENLERLVGREPKKDFILAAVLTRPNVSLYDTLVIDAGTKVGVAPEDLVTAGGVPIGTLERVYADTSVVRLYSTPGQIVLVHLGAEGIQVSAESRGGGNFKARLPRDVVVTEGDAVILPGIEPSLFAIVEKVIVEPSDPFQTFLFKSPVDPYTIQYVEIRKPPANPL